MYLEDKKIHCMPGVRKTKLTLHRCFYNCKEAWSAVCGLPLESGEDFMEWMLFTELINPPISLSWILTFLSPNPWFHLFWSCFIMQYVFLWAPWNHFLKKSWGIHESTCIMCGRQKLLGGGIRKWNELPDTGRPDCSGHYSWCLTRKARHHSVSLWKDQWSREEIKY